jgi:glycosyltransferase involved in cell wall biosynthesis
MGELGAPAAYRIARATGVPNVTRLFGIGMFLDKVRGNKLKFLLRYREKRAITTPADYIILCNDGSQGDRLAGLLGVDSGKLLHWFNGVDKKLYAEGGGVLDVRATLGIPDGNAVVLSVSRLDPEKHVERLLSAASGVLRERGDVTFVVVGSGEERQRLERVAAELGIVDGVVFAGAAGREELVDYYRAADVFVALSDRTNVSNSLHEAMIAGLPAIALNTGATADVVRDGENGVLLEIVDLHRTHEVLLALLGDDERRLALGKRAHESADRRLPTFEERQAMEVSVAERAVREHRARVGQ